MSLDTILHVSDKPNLNMIVSRICHYPFLDFTVFYFLKGKANERTTLWAAFNFHYYAFSSLTLLHPHSSPPAMISVLTWFYNVEGVVITFFFSITGKDEKLRKSWSTKPLEGKQHLFMCSFWHLTWQTYSSWDCREWTSRHTENYYSFQNPLDLSRVSQLLAIHREMTFLQLDAAIRHQLW